jgi:hypothetical protein
VIAGHNADELEKILLEKKSNYLISGILVDSDLPLGGYFYEEKIDISETRLQRRQGSYSFIYVVPEWKDKKSTSKDYRDWYCSYYCGDIGGRRSIGSAGVAEKDISGNTLAMRRS